MLIDVAPLLAAQTALDASRKAELAGDLDAAHRAACEAYHAMCDWSRLLYFAIVDRREKLKGSHEH